VEVGRPSSEVEDAGRREPACPKRMVYGPCGGVRADGRCELDDRRCPFIDRAVVRWSGPDVPPVDRAAFDAPGPTVGGSGSASPARPVIVTDLRVRPFDVASVRAVTARLAHVSDYVLVGEHHARPDYPPTMMASLVQDAGGRPWITLTGRDRNRVALEAELAGLATLGVSGVHCVTGDGRGQGVRADAQQVFDLDGTRLAALARAIGLSPSVAATPLAPPREQRPERLREKQRAGAVACFVNHSGGAAAVSAFVAAARAAGVTMPFVACVAVATDTGSLEILERFPGLVIDPELRRRILSAHDGVDAGIAAAVDESSRMLAIPGVVGVNLSGAACSGPETESAAIMAELAVRVRERARTPR
jgi:5,10-methylenetetrahydrofolate reductase